MNESRVLIAGFPSSGKSSYIATLFSCIEEGHGRLSLRGFSGDFEYVNGLADRLARCEEAVRTEVDRTDGFFADLVTSAGEEVDLRLPDYSGETWKSAIETRGWPASVHADVQECSGICVFLRIDDVTNDGTILDAQSHLNSLLPPGTDVEAGAFGDGTPVLTTQIALVDLLQVILGERRPARSACRVSVVLSAFDLANGLTPQRWLDMNLPLLSQFLRSNQQIMTSRVFGVSAQGGVFDSSESTKSLLARTVVERAFAVNAEGVEVELDTPVSWAAGVGPTDG